MREIVPPVPAVVRNDVAAVKQLFAQHVVPSYGRFDLVLSHGQGSYLWDITGKRYLDFGGGIAVCALGHASPEITEALAEQSQRLVHVSNLYYTEPQGRLAQAISSLISPGKSFFCNSGAEANEGLFKVARKFGHAQGRFEILTTHNSFHGRTLAGISATGQEKVKKGFEPMVPGFRQVPYNDLAALREAISPATAAILIEAIQGESGVTPATPDYLLGLRQLCNEKNLLLLLDEVQCGHYRTGAFHGFQRLLEGVPDGESFAPDGVSMAKSLGGGFPIGAFWVRQPYADLLGPGTHASTYGGTPLGCAVALRVLDVIKRDRLDENARQIGDYLLAELLRLKEKFPTIIKAVRGIGLMVGIEVASNIPALSKDEKAPSMQLVQKLHQAGLLTIPAGNYVIRLLPALNLRKPEAEEGLKIIDAVISKLVAE